MSIFEDITGIKRRKRETVEFLSRMIPDNTNINEKRLLDGFSMVLGNNYEGLGMDRFDEKPVDLKDLTELKYLNPTATDNYFSPNLFKGNKYIKARGSRRSQAYLAWLQAFYIDIDGIEGIKDPKKAQDRLYQVLQELGMKQPDLLVHTSTNPTVHLQAIWLIDPIWVGDSRGGKIDHLRYKKWWVDTATALVEVLSNAAPDLKVDKAKSKDPLAYMRLPGGYNQKTGQEVKVLDLKKRKLRSTLEDGWLNNVRQRYYNLLNKQARIAKRAQELKLLEHPQIKRLRAGVPNGFRNYAQYAIAKACQYDGLKQKEAIEVVLEQNKRCEVPERVSKVEGVVRSVYRHQQKGISAQIVADTVNGAFGLEVKPDPALYLACQDSVQVGSSQVKQGKYIKKYETMYRVIKVIKDFVAEGKKVLPSQAKLADLAGVKYHSLTKYFKRIVGFLSNLGVYLDKKAHKNNRYIIYTVNNLDKLYQELSSNEKIKGDMIEEIIEKVVTKAGEVYDSLQEDLRGLELGLNNCLEELIESLSKDDIYLLLSRGDP